MKRIAILFVAAATLTLVCSAAARHPESMTAAELFPGEGVVTDQRGHQHGEVAGHLPAKQENVEVIGKAQLSVPPGTTAPMEGRVADVAAFGNHAYLTSFSAADCLGGGAWIVDMSNPAAPHQVGFLPTTPGNYAGEGAQVIDVEFGPYAGRQLFIHQNEILAACAPIAAGTGKERFRGGINIWDVTDPGSPELLVEHAGDTDGPVAPNPNDSHSMFAWNSHVDEKVYVVLIDNFEFADLDIMDITDPTNPVMVNDTLDLFDLFGIGADNPPHLQTIFSHDMMVYRTGNRYVMNVNYWDGGYVLLDVTDPRPGQVSLIANWEFPELDDQRLMHGEEMPPAGNAHQSELSPNFNFMIGTDEDFTPFHHTGTITSGPFAGYEFPAQMASAVPAAHHDPGTGELVDIEGPTTFVGLACDPLPAGSGTALIERGVCTFQTKLDNVVAAGYDAGIVFNSINPTCNALVTMAAEGDIPFLFIAREAGLRILGIDVAGAAACTTAAPPPGTPSADVTIDAIFDGWGYVRLFRTKIPGAVGQTGSIEQIGTYAIPEAQDHQFASGFGDLTVHEVAMDWRPGTNLAYLSYYAGGFRVVEYGNDGIREVGAFIDEGGNNFWGVEVHKHANGEHYVLASDRDFGLYIFQYTGKIAGGNRGRSDHNPRP